MTDDTISGPDRAPEPDRTDSSGPMDGLDDQAAQSPGQVLMQIYAFFYKKAVGLVLLLLAGTLSLLGVLFPQMPSSVRGDPEAAARWVESARSVFGGWTDVLRTAGVFTMFSSVPFLVVMALLALSIIACTVHRLPVIWNAARHPRTRVTARFFDRARLRSRFTSPVSAEKAFQVIRADAREHRMRFIVDDGGPGRNAYIDRNRWGPFGTAFAHTAFVIIMAGFVVSSVTGFSDQEFTLTIGHPKDVGHGTALVAEARSFQDTYYEDGSPRDYVADLAIYDGGEEVANREVRINSPLSYDGVVFHQAYFGVAAVLTITDDSGAEVFHDGVALDRTTRDKKLTYGRTTLPDGWRAILLTGAMMPAAERAQLAAILADRPDYQLLEFTPEPLALMRGARAIIAMSGYNTTLELLALNAPMLLVPRIKPRREQWLRAVRLAELGLADCLHPDELSPARISAWLADARPRKTARDRLDFNGLEHINRETLALLTP